MIDFKVAGYKADVVVAVLEVDDDGDLLLKLNNVPILCITTRGQLTRYEVGYRDADRIGLDIRDGALISLDE